MRDPERIPRVLHLLEEYWLKNPGLRLGQIVVNMAAQSGQPFYFEDNEMERRLREVLDREKP
jgi:uncharacterized protein YihD (DUF1040 family)